jgi:excisionase family DNA binding protein
MKVEVPTFLSIREVARTGILSEYTLRLMAKQGQLPSIRSGRKVLVNFDKLVEQLNNVGAQEGTADD